MRIRRFYLHIVYNFSLGIMVHDFLFEQGIEHALNHFHGFWVALLAAYACYILLSWRDVEKLGRAMRTFWQSR
jgi:hypothetical protein